MDISLKLSEEPNGLGLINKDLVRKLIDVARAAKTYRDSHTMEGANKEGELLMDFTARIVNERAKVDEALAALPAWITDG